MLVPAVLIVFGLSFGAFGLWALVMPESLAALLHFGLSTPGAITEIRAFYGGLELGLCALMLTAVVRRSLAPAALWSLVVVAGGIAAVRLVGLALDGSASGLMFGALTWELAGAAGGLAALRALSAGR